jgi:hypothetical protein
MRLSAVVACLLAAACHPGPRAPMVGESTVPDEAPETRDVRPHASSEPTGPCNGEPTAATTKELTARAGDARGCYEQLLRRDPTRTGRIVIGLRIGRTGVVQSAGLVEDEIVDPDFETCVLERVSIPVRHPPAHGCVEVQIPIRFAPEESDRSH